MSSINSLGSSTSQQTQVSSQNSIYKVGADALIQAANSSEVQTSTKTQVSTFSRLISDAATRAEERDSSTNRDGLAAIAQSAVDKLLGESYQKNKATYDAEVPGSDEPQRLAQARQATDFTNGKGGNPFKGMSRDQLALIAYDDSGAFTTNERRAAWDESYDQEQVWKRSVVAKMMDEYHRTGKVSSDSYQDILDHYKSLPAIEEAQLPKDYDTQLKTLIKQTSNTESTQHKEELMSFLEHLTNRLGGNRPA